MVVSAFIGVIVSESLLCSWRPTLWVHAGTHSVNEWCGDVEKNRPPTAIGRGAGGAEAGAETP